MRVQLKNIIATTDFSEYSRFTVPYGVELAREFGAKLYVCHVVDLPPTALYGEAIWDPQFGKDQLMAKTREEMEGLMKDHSIEWEPLVVSGFTADEIELLAKEKSADLVISATHGRSGLKRLVMGSVTERLMRRLTCPLLVVRSSAQAEGIEAKAKVKFSKILVGCDFSPDSTLALEYGMSLAQQFQSELHLVHVIEPSVYKDMLKLKTAPGLAENEDLRVELKAKMEGLIPEEARYWCTPQITLLAGQPHEELVKYALVNDINLLVMGFRGHGLVETMFLGSSTARAVRSAVCPVLSVRPKDL